MRTSDPVEQAEGRALHARPQLRMLGRDLHRRRLRGHPRHRLLREPPVSDARPPLTGMAMRFGASGADAAEIGPTPLIIESPARMKVTLDGVEYRVGTRWFYAGKYRVSPPRDGKGTRYRMFVPPDYETTGWYR